MKEIMIPRKKPFPSNDMAVRYYPAAFSKSDEHSTNEIASAKEVETHFAKNGWFNYWVNGVYSFHHFHAEAHEVLACLSGSATLCLGGPEGMEVEIKAGDVVLLPAGVGHQNVTSSPDFRIAGAYPSGQSPDLRRGTVDEWDEVIHKISETPIWEKDPVTGDQAI